MDPRLEDIRHRLRQEEEQLETDREEADLTFEKLRYDAILEGFRRAEHIIKGYESSNSSVPRDPS